MIYCLTTKARMVTNSHGARGAVPSFYPLRKSEPKSVTDGVALGFIYKKHTVPVGQFRPFIHFAKVKPKA